MSKTNELLDSYYEFIQTTASLRTHDHAKRWSTGVLKTLGTALDGKTKKSLAKVLPQELSESLNGVFWLLHFRDPNLSTEEFCRRTARRSGNSDAEFAVRPTLAVFAGLQRWVDDDLNTRIADSLSPEIRSMWEQARPIDTRT